jgi:hypothetical protein
MCPAPPIIWNTEHSALQLLTWHCLCDFFQVDTLSSVVSTWRSLKIQIRQVCYDFPKSVVSYFSQKQRVFPLFLWLPWARRSLHWHEVVREEAATNVSPSTWLVSRLETTGFAHGGSMQPRACLRPVMKKQSWCWGLEGWVLTVCFLIEITCTKCEDHTCWPRTPDDSWDGNGHVIW